MQQKSLVITLAGKPNAGKSTLLNQLIKYRLSIITPKAQTTRNVIKGVLTIKNTQLILFDSPGIFSPKTKLEKTISQLAWSALRSSHITALIIDVKGKIDDDIKNIINTLQNETIETIVLLNKIDTYPNNLLTIQDEINQLIPKAKIFPISALNNDGVDNLLEFFIKKAKVSPWIYDKDDITNVPMRFLTAEITREQLFLELKQELPYNLTVITEQYEEKKDKVTIKQVIIVAKENHKKIIIGKNGEKIKKISMQARQNIEEYLNIKSDLFLFVSVKKHWLNNPDYFIEGKY